MRSFSSYPPVRQEVRAERCGDLSTRAEVPIGNCRRPCALHRRRIPNGPYVYATSDTAACVFPTAQADGGKAAANVPPFRTLLVSPFGRPGSLKDRAVL